MNTSVGPVCMDARVKPEHDGGGVVGETRPPPPGLGRRLIPLGPNAFIHLSRQGQRPLGGEGVGGQKL
jgi:hypothetical protein